MKEVIELQILNPKWIVRHIETKATVTRPTCRVSCEDYVLAVLDEKEFRIEVFGDT